MKLKESEVSKAETKFLKMKAWSKSRIRQLEQELKKVQVRKYIVYFIRFACKYSAKFNELLSVFDQSGVCLDMSPDITSLHGRITELQEEREEMLSKLELYEDMKAKNGINKWI